MHQSGINFVTHCELRGNRGKTWSCTIFRPRPIHIPSQQCIIRIGSSVNWNIDQNSNQEYYWNKFHPLSNQEMIGSICIWNIIFFCGIEGKRDGVSFGNQRSNISQSAANLVTINLNNQSTNNQLDPPQPLLAVQKENLKSLMWRKLYGETFPLSIDHQYQTEKADQEQQRLLFGMRKNIKNYYETSFFSFSWSKISQICLSANSSSLKEDYAQLRFNVWYVYTSKWIWWWYWW